ncbi:hypothetical protein Tsubulata_300585 [Turnera subulata]|uniref:Ketoreductase domain-containing protein n=1 Tax=Turnera subulata TaxID=218843 RepID=A0A9Q0GJH2_9ROSI|nr:hypothetical protein Tsubulata_300585 [Turnera subulata]
MAPSHTAANIVVPAIVLPSLVLSLPLILASKVLGRIKRSLFKENMKGKVVLITGASSGIGERVAYEYAKRGARLALVARREDRLQEVAKKAKTLGSPDVVVIRADVTKPEDCKRLVDEAVNHFGQLNHLVNNAGIWEAGFFEDCTDVSRYAKDMDINFWGTVRITHQAVPHLRKSKGRIVVISSTLGWYPAPKSSFYNASKAAVTAFFETLSVEFGSDIGVTIVTPGLTDSEMIGGNFLKEAEMQDTPVMPADACAKSIVNSACRGDRYLTEPFWMRIVFLAQLLTPEFLNWFNHKRVAAGITKKTA